MRVTVIPASLKRDKIESVYAKVKVENGTVEIILPDGTLYIPKKPLEKVMKEDK